MTLDLTDKSLLTDKRGLLAIIALPFGIQSTLNAIWRSITFGGSSLHIGQERMIRLSTASV